jgi:hypothetical protein
MSCKQLQGFEHSKFTLPMHMQVPAHTVNAFSSLALHSKAVSGCCQRVFPHSCRLRHCEVAG